jgi:23S rRNA (cytidine1920-2'-O)/16S rRNA (cytidine1409-2'-O)-methyltransferase
MTDSKERVDLALVHVGLVETRSQAQNLILEGVVFWNGKKILKASEKVSFEGLEIKKEHQFVSRGADKIAGAISFFNLKLSGKTIADCGASTGGFSEYALYLGVEKVYAIDVGHNQLASKLLNDPRIFNFEGVNLKYAFELPEFVDFALVDLSFISLKLVLKNILNLVRPSGSIVALVKPQFEVGPKGLDKNGIVKNEELRISTIEDVKSWCQDNGIKIVSDCPSQVSGKNGNLEHFILIQR